MRPKRFRTFHLTKRVIQKKQNLNGGKGLSAFMGGPPPRNSGSASIYLVHTVPNNNNNNTDNNNNMITIREHVRHRCCSDKINTNENTLHRNRCSAVKVIQNLGHTDDGGRPPSPPPDLFVTISDRISEIAIISDLFVHT